MTVSASHNHPVAHYLTLILRSGYQFSGRNCSKSTWRSPYLASKGCATFETASFFYDWENDHFHHQKLKNLLEKIEEKELAPSTKHAQIGQKKIKLFGLIFSKHERSQRRARLSQNPRGHPHRPNNGTLRHLLVKASHIWRKFR